MENKEQTISKVVHTYTDDMAEVIQSDKAGLVKKIIHGEEKHEMEKKNLSPKSKKNRFFLFGGFTLIILATAVLLFFIFWGSNNTVPSERQFIPIIFNDKSSFIEVRDLNKEEIIHSILNEVRTGHVKSGGLEGIYLSNNKKMVGLREFITFIKGSLVLDDPNSTISRFNNNFLLGFVNNDTRDFFILLKVRSIPDVFEPMRAWESKMFSDLHEFFGVSISSDTKYLLTKDFSDGIVANKNARILYDQDDDIVMMYVLADDNSLIIANTEATTREIILRLASSQIKK